MKLLKEQFIAGRIRHKTVELAEKEYTRLVKAREIRAKNAVNIYLDEYGNEVHVQGPLINRVRKVETLQERIARFDRLAAAVNASRQAMAFVANEIGVIGVDKHGQPIFADGVIEDPADFDKLTDVPEIDAFGEVIPVAKPAQPEETPADNGGAGISGDEPVSQPSAPADPAMPSPAPAGE